MAKEVAATSAKKPLLLREPPPPGGGQVVRVEDVDRELVDRWVIMRVTAMDGGWPIEGYVIAHDRSEKRCWEKFHRAVAAGEPREALHAVFVASPRVRNRAEMLAAMKELEDASPAAEDQLTGLRS